MSKVSVLIPSRNERFLTQTVNDIFAKASGDIEVIVTLDGYWPDDWKQLQDKHGARLKPIHKGTPEGMRAGINDAAAISTGEYLMKSDAHCMFAEGFDEVLKADCEDDWIVIPRRYRLDAENWKIQQDGKIPIDAHYLSWPYEKPEEIGMHGNIWNERSKATINELISDEMSTQGSCWFMSKKHWERLGGMPHQGYGQFVQEAQQICNKTWLGGGRVVVNKKTWYAHLHKGKAMGRGYFISKPAMVKGTHWSADYWINNRWPEAKFGIEWLVEKFNPPGWPEDWQYQRRLWELGPDGLSVRKEVAA